MESRDNQRLTAEDSARVRHLFVEDVSIHRVGLLCDACGIVDVALPQPRSQCHREELELEVLADFFAALAPVAFGEGKDVFFEVNSLAIVGLHLRRELLEALDRYRFFELGEERSELEPFLMNRCYSCRTYPLSAAITSLDRQSCA